MLHVDAWQGNLVHVALEHLQIDELAVDFALDSRINFRQILRLELLKVGHSGLVELCERALHERYLLLTRDLSLVLLGLLLVHIDLVHGVLQDLLERSQVEHLKLLVEGRLLLLKIRTEALPHKRAHEAR